jgi:hypothetical protein
MRYYDTGRITVVPHALLELARTGTNAFTFAEAGNEEVSMKLAHHFLRAE